MESLINHLQNISDRFFELLPTPQPTLEQFNNVKIVAHRGAWSAHCPENTMAAFEVCLNKNIWGIEFDLRWTKDDHPVINHDPCGTRVFKSERKIIDMTLKELKMNTPEVPELSEVVNRFKKKLHLMIELKTLLTPKQTLILKEILSPLSPVHDYHFMSLEVDFLKPVSFVPPKAKVTIARTNMSFIYKETLRQNLGALTGHYLLLSSKMLKNCHKEKIKVGTGFPDSKKLFYREVARDVDWIFTNKALQLASYQPKNHIT